MNAHVLGWTLVHSVWESALIAALLVTVRANTRSASSHARYLMCVTGLALMLVAPIVTAALLYGAGHGGAAGSVSFSGLPTMPAGARERVDFLTPWLVDAWLIGVLAFSVRLVAGLARTRALVMDGTQPADEWVDALARKLMNRVGIRRVIRVLESTRVRVPLVAGWLRPVLLIPGSLVTGLTPFQLELIIVHELAHIRRHDYLVNVCQAVAETLLFYHPAVWWVSARVREEREHCCDDFTLAMYGGSAREYASVLLAIEESRGDALGFAAAATGGSLLRRVKRLLGGDVSLREPRARSIIASSGLALAAIFVGTLSTGLAPAALHETAGLMVSRPVSAVSLVLAPSPVTPQRLDVEALPHVTRRPVKTPRAVVQEDQDVAVSTLVQELGSSPSDSESEQIVDLIGRRAGETALDALAEVVRTDSSVAVEASAVRTIGRLRLSAAVDTLSAMAADLPTPQLRNTAVTALSQTPIASHAADALRLLALGTAARSVRQQAAYDLTRFGSKLAVPALADVVDNSVDREVQHTALQSLGRLAPDDQALSALKQVVWTTDTRPDLQRWAMRQIQGVPGRPAFVVDSAFLTQVVEQHTNDAVLQIAHKMLGGS